MAQINLLPWREEKRAQQTQEFTVQAALAGLFAAVVVFYGYYLVGGMIDHQKFRNNHLKKEIQVLQDELKEITELEKQKEQLLSRMKVIQTLQTRRPQVVHLFYEMAATLPEGVYLQTISQKHNKLTIAGKSDSNARVSAYMRNLAASEWIKNPVLDEIKADPQSTEASFVLTIEQTSPNENTKKEDE